MVHLIERKGYSALVTNVFSKESDITSTVNEVFVAFLKMVELEHKSIEEIITYLSPEDFHTSIPDLNYVTQITTDDTITDTADLSELVNVQGNALNYYYYYYKYIN